MKPVPLTLPLAYELAAHLCPVHRDAVLRVYPSVWAWARSRVELPGSAWAFLQDGPVGAGGVMTRGDTGVLWLAGREGWQRYVKHALKVCRGILASGAYQRYVAEVTEGFEAGMRFVEHLGFSRLGSSSGCVLYGVKP